MKTNTNVYGWTMLDNLSFGEDQLTRRVSSVRRKATKGNWTFMGLVRGTTTGIDLEKEVVYVFFDQADFDRSPELAKKYCTALEKAWKEAGFTFEKEENVPGDRYFEVGFVSTLYKVWEKK